VGPRSSDENSAIHQSLLEHLHLGLGGRRRTDHQHFDGVTDCAGRLACINHISSTKQILSWRKIAISLIDRGEETAQDYANAWFRQFNNNQFR
jgi:hypothetical protein